MDNNFLKAEMKIDLQSIYTTNRVIRFEHIANLQGILNSGFQPKYKQLGTTFIWHPGYYYFAVKIEKASGLEQLEDTTSLEIYATVEWGGQVQRTRSICDASIPVFNETFYFLIPLGDAELKNEPKMIEAIKNEFQTKSRVWVSLWRKFFGGALAHLGSASFNIGDISEAKPDDVNYITEDKRCIIYEARVLAKNLLLASSFNEDLLANVSLKAWFFYDLPAVLDLGPYRRDGDEYPRETEAEMRNREYERPWNDIVSEIYEYSDISREIRRFVVYAKDHCRREHFICLFLTSMSPPDQGSIDTTSFPFDHKIRSIGEVAHFIRCIPYLTAAQSFWISPDTCLAMQKGTVIDHALLMASLFIGSNFESFDELKKKFVELRKKDAQKNELLAEAARNKENLEYFEDQLEKLMKKEKFTVEDDGTQPSETKAAGNGEEGEEAEPEEEIKEEKNEDEEDENKIPLSNRVFVCLGTDRIKKIPYAWVMTFDPECHDATLWDPVCHTQYFFKARVKNKELLKEFLKYKPRPEGSV